MEGSHETVTHQVKKEGTHMPTGTYSSKQDILKNLFP